MFKFFFPPPLVTLLRSFSLSSFSCNGIWNIPLLSRPAVPLEFEGPHTLTPIAITIMKFTSPSGLANDEGPVALRSSADVPESIAVRLVQNTHRRQLERLSRSSACACPVRTYGITWGSDWAFSNLSNLYQFVNSLLFARGSGGVALTRRRPFSVYSNMYVKDAV